MKFRNGVLMMTAAALVLQASGATEVEMFNASNEEPTSAYELQMNYKDVSVQTPHYQSIFQLKEMGLLDLGEEFLAENTITYAHLAYVLTNAKFEFSAPLGVSQGEGQFDVYQPSIDYLVNKGIYTTSLDMTAEVTHEGLVSVLTKAFAITEADAAETAKSYMGAELDMTKSVTRGEMAHYLFQMFMSKQLGGRAITEAPIVEEAQQPAEEVNAAVEADTAAETTATEETPVAEPVAAPVAEIASARTIQFTDTVNHWASKDIQMAVEKGYVDGYGDGTFRPESPVAHSEFTKMLVSALGYDVTNGDGNSWYVPYVDTAIQQGFLGQADKANTPWGNQMSRTEVVTTSLKFLNQMPSNPKKVWYNATSIGLMQGKDATGNLDATGTLTRAEAITIIERVVTLKAGGTLAVDKAALSRAEVLYHNTNLFTMLPNAFPAHKMDTIDLSQYSYVSPDGHYRSDNYKIVVADLDNPNDPYAYLIHGTNMGVTPQSTAGLMAIITMADHHTGTNPMNHYSLSGGMVNSVLGVRGVAVASYNPYSAAGIQKAQSKYSPKMVAYFNKADLLARDTSYVSLQHNPFTKYTLETFDVYKSY